MRETLSKIIEFIFRRRNPRDKNGFGKKGALKKCIEFINEPTKTCYDKAVASYLREIGWDPNQLQFDISIKEKNEKEKMRRIKNDVESLESLLKFKEKNKLFTLDRHVHFEVQLGRFFVSCELEELCSDGSGLVGILYQTEYDGDRRNRRMKLVKLDFLRHAIVHDKSYKRNSNVRMILYYIRDNIGIEKTYSPTRTSHCLELIRLALEKMSMGRVSERDNKQMQLPFGSGSVAATVNPQRTLTTMMANHGLK